MKVVINSAQNLIVFAKDLNTREYKTILSEITITTVTKAQQLQQILENFPTHDVEVWDIATLKRHLKYWLK